MKPECRMTKAERMPKSQSTKMALLGDHTREPQTKPGAASRGFRHSDFGFLSSFVIRHLSFGELLCKLRLAAVLLAFMFASRASAAPLSVFIRAGVKTHGPNQHDHPRFFEDWKKLLSERGLTVDGAMDFPTPTQLANTDVLIIYAQD